MRSQKSTIELKLIAAQEHEIASLRQTNAKLLRMVELVMEQRFYRPTVTGGVRENSQDSGMPIELLNDVATFDQAEDTAQSKEQQKVLEDELTAIQGEHSSWRTEKGLADDAA